MASLHAPSSRVWSSLIGKVTRGSCPELQSIWDSWNITGNVTNEENCVYFSALLSETEPACRQKGTLGRTVRGPPEACLSNNKCFPLSAVFESWAFVLLNMEHKPRARANRLGQERRGLCPMQCPGSPPN